MTKHLLFTLILAIAPLCAISQSTSSAMHVTNERLDQVVAMKIGYMSAQIELTSDQSILFWPLYNEYWKARYDLFERKRKAQERINANRGTAADIDELIKVEEDQAKLMRSFVSRFEKVLSVDQTAKMFVAEEEFKSVLLKTLK